MAKIPFDIRYRSQIESGEYKVETRDGRPVRIICWDAKRRYGDSICGFMGEEEDCPYFWQPDGSWWANRIYSLNDIIIITPEPELSEFEEALEVFLMNADSSEETFHEEVKKHAAELLELAKDEIYSHESLVEYAKKAKAEGKAEALKDLPRWKRDKSFETGGTFMGVKGGECFVVKDGYSISVAELIEKLPGFKEDEK